jgi:methionine synthase I (cobalamin-dependent)
MTTENGTNGESKPNIIAELHQAWVDAGKKKPNDATMAKLVKAYKEASKARETAEQAYVAAKSAESAAVKAIVLNRGKGRVSIGGRTLTPMSKGESVYFRPESTGVVEKLD